MAKRAGLVAVLPACQGRVFYFQINANPVAIARQGIGRKFQKPTVFEALTVAENLALAMKGDKSVWASLRARMSSEQDDRLNEVLRLLRLDGERYRQAGLLSHGQKQFLEIGMLLVQEPHLLFCMFHDKCGADSST